MGMLVRPKMEISASVSHRFLKRSIPKDANHCSAVAKISNFADKSNAVTVIAAEINVDNISNLILHFVHYRFKLLKLFPRREASHDWADHITFSAIVVDIIVFKSLEYFNWVRVIVIADGSLQTRHLSHHFGT
jgi:hypothetical protein